MPKLNTIICFDNSISYSMQNVKFPEQDLQVNKEKANKVLRSNGLQLPPENTLNGSNNSISPSTEKVNSSEKISSKSYWQREKLNSTMMEVLR